MCLPLHDLIASAMWQRGGVGPAFKAVFQFTRFMITLPITLVRGRRGKMDEVTVYSAHPSFFLWLLIAVGFTASAIVARYPQEAGLLGWAELFH